MSLYILDTDTVTFQQAGREILVHHLRSVSAESVCTTVVTLYEQLRGRLAMINRAQTNPALIQAYEQLQKTVKYFSFVPILPFTSSAADQFETLRAKRVNIGTQDLRIASIVLSVNGILITSNRRDFGKVPGLIIEDWVGF
jgi:tRNA(fMet)-specific endonuclease VapC